MSFFKRLLGIDKAYNRPTEDTKIDFEVKDLKIGYVFDYDMQSWEVKDVSVYTWDNGVKDFEYTIFDGANEYYLNYESASEALSIYWKGSINEIWGDARGKMRKNLDMSDATFNYKNEAYYFSGEGSAKVVSKRESFFMQNWLFESDAENLVSFNKYNDGSVEAYVGKKLPRHAVTNILKR